MTRRSLFFRKPLKERFPFNEYTRQNPDIEKNNGI